MILGPKPLLRCIKTRGEVADLLARAAVLAMHDQKLRQYLPDPLNRHCMLANLRGSTAILAVDSAGWASRLRYLTPALLPHLVEMGLPVTRIEVTLVPPLAPPRRVQRPGVIGPSPDAAPASQRLAARSDDPAFAAVLCRLAGRANRARDQDTAAKVGA